MNPRGPILEFPADSGPPKALQSMPSRCSRWMGSWTERRLVMTVDAMPGLDIPMPRGLAELLAAQMSDGSAATSA